MKRFLAGNALFAWLVVAAGFALLAGEPCGAAEPAKAQPFPGQKTVWNGYDRYDFPFDGRAAIVVTPKEPAPGKPWIWRARFFGHEPGVDLALLAKGFHLVYIDVADMFGGPEAVGHWNAFYKFLADEHGFAKRAALEGLSRGGLIVYNWAAANPDKVACIHADAPVCDIRSWPGGLGRGPGSPQSWALCLKAYGLTPEQAKTFKGNPIDHLEPLAKAGVPLLHVCGDADETVPLDENTRVLESRYKKLGGKIDVIIKPGVGHHPHSLKDPTPIVEFILKHTQGEGKPAGKLRIVFFGAHCDDSELASGGLMVMLSQAGHEVFSAYGTTHRGQRKINGQPEDVVRRGESTAACKILGATPKFFPYPHETLFADPATVEAVRKWFDEIKPDIVVTHWPMDTHPNHHVVSSLVWLCYDHRGRTWGQDPAATDAKPAPPSWNLYFNEVNTFTKNEDLQTLGYQPQLYLDIEKVRDVKHRAIECLVSQNPAELWQVHDNMHRRRGEECGARYAEAYFLVEPKPGCPTLPVEFLRKK